MYENLLVWMVYFGIASITIGIFLVVISRNKKIDREFEKDAKLFNSIKEVLGDLEDGPKGY